MTKSAFSKFKDLFRSATNTPTVNLVPTIGESYAEKLTFAGNIEQLTSDFLRGRMKLVLNGELLDTLLIKKFKEYSSKQEPDPSIFKGIDKDGLDKEGEEKKEFDPSILKGIDKDGLDKEGEEKKEFDPSILKGIDKDGLDKEGEEKKEFDPSILKGIDKDGLDKEGGEKIDTLMQILDTLNEKLTEKGLAPINLESPGMTEHHIVAEILKEQLFKNSPSFDAFESTQALSQFLHQGNSLFNIRGIIDKQLVPLNCGLSLSSSKKAEQVFERCYFYPHEDSTPEHPKFSLKQYCHISTDIMYDQNPEDIRIEASKPHNDLIIGECIQSFDLTHNHGKFKATPTLESLKISSPNAELDAFLHRTSENNAHVTKMFQDYIDSNKPEETHRYKP